MQLIMRSFNKLLLCLATIAAFFNFQGCTKSNIPAIDFGYNYFPVNINHYIIYDVDSVNKDAFTGLVTHSSYQIKEVIAGVYNDNEGRPTLRIERFRKDTSTYIDWTIFQVWTANLTTTTAQRFEDNKRYVKLTFPVKENRVWNGNSMNTEDAEDYTYQNVNQPEYFNQLVFDSVLTVLQADDLSNIISPKYKLEKYASGVGLVYRKKFEVTMHTNPITGNLDTSAFVDYTESILSFGN
ncbi:MAG: hypothetical protein JNK61_06855 [Bacteroidia bacterium]|nr:hypothetical protein [Bacteroidia bacterium]HQU99914.1 hypothetical protein [Bacteroidia bacterium]